jgi:hypothetical protein
MPRQSKGARLWLEPADAKSTSVWIIKDGKHRESTGCGSSELGKAEQALNDYITRKYQVPRLQKGDPADIRIADAITIYSDEVAPSAARPKELAARLGDNLMVENRVSA